jgi:SAM-dependent methyltransferase
MRPFGKYSHYYDLLYRDKDYAGEADYVDNLIHKFHLNTKSILDLGCGTGRHAMHLVKKGYLIHGVDMSEEMLAEAIKRADEEQLTFSEGDIRTIRLDKSFDAIIALFHVISYQTSNEDLQRAFAAACEHLKPDGVLIFDCWYGPAVLTERPVVRIKRVEDDKLEITRLAEPVMRANENVVDVAFHAFIRDKESGVTEEVKETHQIRYLFKPELELLLNQAGFVIEGSFEFQTNKGLDYNTWNACFVARKK